MHLSCYMRRIIASIIKVGFEKMKPPSDLRNAYVSGVYGRHPTHRLIYRLHEIFCGWGYFWWIFFLDDVSLLFESELCQAGERREICVVREGVIQLDFGWIAFSEWKRQVYSLDYKSLNGSIFLPSWSLLLITLCSWIYLVQPLFNI